MTTKTKEVVQLPQEEVVIEGPQTAASIELRGMVDKKLQNLMGAWKERREAYKTVLESATPVLPVSRYRYWDCLLLGPYQKSTFDRPSKIIAAEQEALMVGLIWINPANSPGGGVSGTVVMGGEDYYRCFEMIDLSLVQNIVLPNSDAMETFPDIPPEFTPVYWSFTLPDPGVHPKLYEVHFYVDVVKAGQPFATMATWHWDPEGDEWFPGWTPTDVPRGYPMEDVPVAWRPYGPHFDHDIPARFLVHRA